jgi:hypothetical protein
VRDIGSKARRTHNERYGLWLLKNSTFLKTVEIWGMENVYQNRGRRLSGILTQDFFDHFPEIDFFNTYACLQQSEAR